MRLLVVGARYTRDYEVQYVEEVKRAINGDPRIELYDVTENVECFYEVCIRMTIIVLSQLYHYLIVPLFLRRRMHCCSPPSTR